MHLTSALLLAFGPLTDIFRSTAGRREKHVWTTDGTFGEHVSSANLEEGAVLTCTGRAGPRRDCRLLLTLLEPRTDAER